MKDTLDYIIQITNNTTLLWKEAAHQSIPPQLAAKKIDDAMLDWMRELTKTLRLWTDKGGLMTSGELILARANLGAIVESWHKFFYCVYVDDYQKNPIPGSKGAIAPNDLSFEDLKRYSRGILYTPNDDFDNWVSRVQSKRNAIHSFNYREIGSADDFYDDIEKLYDFIELITDRVPPVEDYIQAYPAGYEHPYMKRERVAVQRHYDF